MAIAELGACEWFVMELRRSGLIERGQLEQVVGEFLKKQPRAEAQALADYLVNQNILTAFQAERIISGKAQGLVLGPYTLLDAIGSGSMGTVYKAISKNDGQHYAVKVLPRRSMWNVRLARRQVRAFSSFNNASVVPFIDVGTAGGLHYLSWPLVEGEALDKLVEREGKLAPATAALYGVQIAQGMAIAHQNGLFHGLLKPSNLLIGTDSVARILDFGIGSLLVENEGESLVDTMSTANTLTSGLDCSSPESILEPTNRTPAGDQYSLGCVLYFCLTGQYPFPDGSAVEKMMAHQSKEPRPVKELNPDVPDEIVAVIKRLMAKDPAQRYAMMDEVVEALQPFAAEAPRVPTLPKVAATFTETPRPAGIGSLGNRAANSQNLRQALTRPSGASAAQKPVAAANPGTGSLPANVRLPNRGSAPAAALIPNTPAAEQPAADAAPNYPIPAAAQPNPQSTSFSPATLVLCGMALMGGTYWALSYLQIFK